ncbi:MAG: glycosyltransferase, partial [Candidatus Caldarchaeum sp.]
MHYSGWLIVLGVATFGMIYPYTIYPLCLWLLSRVVRRQKVLRQHYQIFPFTVIIPVYNEEKVIQRKLLNTLQCAERVGAPYEIIVVSDGSTDRTAEIVRGFERTVTLIELPQRGGKMTALRAGVEASSYDILVFTDADAFLHEDALLNLLRHFVNPQVGGIGGTYQSEAGENSGLEGESVKSKMDRWIRTYQSMFHSAIGSTGT